jgi:hypothetical protein
MVCGLLLQWELGRCLCCSLVASILDWSWMIQAIMKMHFLDSVSILVLNDKFCDDWNDDDVWEIIM